MADQVEHGAVLTILRSLLDFGADIPAALAELSAPTDEPDPWAPVGIEAVLSGQLTAPDAELLRRTDGAALLYPGRVHMFYGESESGKTWVALHAVASLLADGGTALYVDLESDATTVVGRLMSLGVPAEALRERFTYVRPDAPPSSSPGFQRLLRTPYDLAVIDGSSDAYALFGLNQNDAADVSLFMRKLPRPLAEGSGAATILIDHVPKGSGGRFAQGSQNKLSAVTGAAYLIEPTEALGAGVRGVVVMRVTKDRPGKVRAVAGVYRKSDRTQIAAQVVIDSTGGSTVFEVQPPDADDDVSKADEWENLKLRIIEYLDAYPGAGITQIRDGVTGSSSKVAEALGQLVMVGRVRAEAGKRKDTFRHFVADPLTADYSDGQGIFAHD
ncbi:AAA family ATPase [Streptomyces sp. NPDC086669]|uniref:AAA family ATPase n=1 Tax=Streptomyces sp. NPDC086669 TaxID=3365753 RepID=UPI0038131E27